MGVDVDTDIDVDVDVVGSAWGSRPGGQWYHSCDSCGPTTTRAWFFLLHLLHPPTCGTSGHGRGTWTPVAHLDVDVGRGRGCRRMCRRARGLFVTLKLGWGAELTEL